MITDTSMIRREEREPLHAESHYFLKRHLATFDSVAIWVPSQGQYKSSRSKHGKWKPVAPTHSPVPGAHRQLSDVQSWLNSKGKKEGNGTFLAGLGVIMQLVLGAHLSIQAFRVNLPSLWRFFYTLKTSLHNHLPPRAFEHRSCVHSLVSHTSQGLEVPREDHAWECSDFKNLDKSSHQTPPKCWRQWLDSCFQILVGPNDFGRAYAVASSLPCVAERPCKACRQS